MFIHRDIRTLLLGALLLALGPVLLSQAPDLRPADSDTPWRLPANMDLQGSSADSTFQILIPELLAKQTEWLRWEKHSFLFQRFAYSVTRMDADLVPWFSPNWRGLIRQNSYRSGRDRRIQVTHLERLSGTGGVVVAQAFRIGPYVTASFNRAKLLQVPAKLQGFANLDLVYVVQECRRDCNTTAELAVQTLDEILDANATDRAYQ
jgi:hypothetical protein